MWLQNKAAPADGEGGGGDGDHGTGEGGGGGGGGEDDEYYYEDYIDEEEMKVMREANIPQVMSVLSWYRKEVLNLWVAIQKWVF